MYAECTDFAGNPSAGAGERRHERVRAAHRRARPPWSSRPTRKTHGGATPDARRWSSSSSPARPTTSQAPADEQGAGLVDAYRAVARRRVLPGPRAGAHAGDRSSRAPRSSTRSAPAGTAETFTEQLTNAGRRPQTVNLSSRTLGAYSIVDTTTVNLSDTTSPHSVDYQGFTDNYEVVHFTVPGRSRPAQRLDRVPGRRRPPWPRVSAWPWSTRRATWPTTRCRRASATTATRRWPTRRPGTWTAYIWSRDTAGGGTTGPVVFGASVAALPGLRLGQLVHAHASPPGRRDR